MTSVVYRDSSGAERLIEAEEGQSVMSAAVRDALPGIIGECGGELMCATCHVYVVSPATDGPTSDDEDEMLEFAACERRANSRLSCQLPVTPDVDWVVETPEAQN